MGRAEEPCDTRVEIIADLLSGRAPIIVNLRAKLLNLKEPATYKWAFGDGQVSTKKVPGPHYYPGGKYNVVLEVIEATGKKYSSSITIDSASPG